MLEARKLLLATSKTKVKEVGWTSTARPRSARTSLRLLRIVARLRHQTDVAYVLGLLLEKGPQRVGEIAQALGTDPSTVSRKVAALVDAGLVERRVDPDDGRAHLLAATPAGEQQVRRRPPRTASTWSPRCCPGGPKTPAASWPRCWASSPTDCKNTE